MPPAKKSNASDDSPPSGRTRRKTPARKATARPAAKSPAEAPREKPRKRAAEASPARARRTATRGVAAELRPPPPAPVPEAVLPPTPDSARSTSRPRTSVPTQAPTQAQTPAPTTPAAPGLTPPHVAPPAPPAHARAAGASAAGAPPLGPQTPTRVIPPLPDDEDDEVPFEGDSATSRGGARREREEEGEPAENADEDGADEDGAESQDAGAAAVAAGRFDEPIVDARSLVDAVRRGERHVSALDTLSDADVASLATQQGWRPRPGERRAETLYRLVQESGNRTAAPAAAPESVFTEGLLELHADGYGFLRRPQNHYAQHPFDVYVAAGIVRRYLLKPGHWVSGQAHRARPGEPYFALHDLEEVNHDDPARLQGLKRFEELTVVYPDTRYVLEVNPTDVEMRLIDLFCPLGRGQRGLIVAPPRTGKTVLLQKIADAVAHNSPNADIVVLLVDERPEEVTNLRRSVRGEVIASTFDRPVANHVRIAELVVEKVKRMVELGRHVVLLLDSITRLGRAYNNLAPTSGRILSGGMDAGALTKPKNFFAVARNVEDGGSLTILATALVDTGSRLDQLIFEEFKGTGNMELVLDRELANQRIWPAINIPASGTRNEDLLLHPEELRRITRLRRALSDHAPADAMLALKDLMKQYGTNAELIMSIQ